MTGHSADAPHIYALALGSNRRSRGMAPADVLRAALADLDIAPVEVLATAPIEHSAAIGPSLRRYANGAAIVASTLAPDALLLLLKDMERAYGRRRGRRWGARPLDIDIILWSGGIWSDRTLAIPHVGFRSRAFVLSPLHSIAPTWRDPVTGLTIAQLRGRFAMRKPVDRMAKPL